MEPVRTSEQRERMAKLSLRDARGYRDAAVYLTRWAAEDEAYDGGRTTDGLVASKIRAALGHEVWGEYLVGRLSWDEYLVADKMLPSWQGEALDDFLDAVRAVAS